MKYGRCLGRRMKEIEGVKLLVKIERRRKETMIVTFQKKLRSGRLNQQPLVTHFTINAYSTNQAVWELVLVMKTITISMKNHFLLIVPQLRFTKT